MYLFSMASLLTITHLPVVQFWLSLLHDVHDTDVRENCGPQHDHVYIEVKLMGRNTHLLTIPTTDRRKQSLFRLE